MTKNTTRIEVTTLADSISPEGIRLRTYELVYPYVVHAEFMTHRVFSRNAASFRAVPTEVFINEVMKAPFMPIHWGRNQRGMQASVEMNEPVSLRYDYYDMEKGEQKTEIRTLSREKAWLSARDEAVRHAEAFANAGEPDENNYRGYHKQIVNRLLAPFVHMRVVVSSTYWKNFDTLRDHEDADPVIRELARKIIEEGEKSTPKLLQPGEWHLPYITDEERAEHPIAILLKLSAERCARTSYKLSDGSNKGRNNLDFTLWKQLIESFPVHASPIEHQATPDEYDENERLYGRTGWVNKEKHGNFRGWIQHRHCVKGESVMEDYLQ